jgi:hypothetical protein
MRQRPKTSFFAAESNANIKWHTYLGYFNDDEARIQVHFYQGKCFAWQSVCIVAKINSWINSIPFSKVYRNVMAPLGRSKANILTPKFGGI